MEYGRYNYYRTCAKSQRSPYTPASTTAGVWTGTTQQAGVSSAWNSHARSPPLHIILRTTEFVTVENAQVGRRACGQLAR